MIAPALPSLNIGSLAASISAEQRLVSPCRLILPLNIRGIAIWAQLQHYGTGHHLVVATDLEGRAIRLGRPTAPLWAPEEMEAR